MRHSNRPGYGTTHLSAEQLAEAVEPLLTITDVTRVLSISRTSVYRLIETGDLVPIRVGARLRFAPEDIRALLNRGRVKHS